MTFFTKLAKQYFSRLQRKQFQRLKGRRRLFVEQLEERIALAAGGLDPSFGGGVRVIATSLHSHAADLAAQTDGKTVVVGSIQRDTAGDYDFFVSRLLANGSSDTSFGSRRTGGVVIPFDLGGNISDMANAVAIQSDGKIVVAGTVTSRSGDTDMGVVRLNMNGTLDSTFGVNGKVTVAFNRGAVGRRQDRATDVAISSGRIILVGSSQSSTGDYDFAFARLSSNGFLDRTFSSDGKNIAALNLGGDKFDEATSVAVQGDGKIVAVGSARKSTTDTQSVVMRLNTNGSFDTTFGQGGKVLQGDSLFDRATGVVIQSNGRIVVGGYSQMTSAGDYDFRVTRLLVTGAMDTSFSGDGTTTISFNLGQSNRDLAYGVAVQADGKILIAGSVQRARTGDTDMGIVRLTSTGRFDTTFGTGGGVVVPLTSLADGALSIKIRPNGRIVVAGFAQSQITAKYQSVLVQMFAT